MAEWNASDPCLPVLMSQFVFCFHEDMGFDPVLDGQNNLQIGCQFVTEKNDLSVQGLKGSRIIFQVDLFRGDSFFDFSVFQTLFSKGSSLK
jgi:hypothetical protein